MLVSTVGCCLKKLQNIFCGATVLRAMAYRAGSADSTKIPFEKATAIRHISYVVLTHEAARLLRLDMSTGANARCFPSGRLL